MSRDLLSQLRDYGHYHQERQLPIEGEEIPLDIEDIPIITIEKGKATDMKPKHWGMLMAAAAVVIVVMIAGGGGHRQRTTVTIPMSRPSQRSISTSSDGGSTPTDRRRTVPWSRCGWNTTLTGTYAMIAWPDVRADRGRYEFEDDVLTIRHDGGRGCEQLEGNPTGVYRLIFTGDDAATFEVVTDECSARENVLDGAQIARIPAG